MSSLTGEEIGHAPTLTLANCKPAVLHNNIASEKLMSWLYAVMSSANYNKWKVLKHSEKQGRWEEEDARRMSNSQTEKLRMNVTPAQHQHTHSGQDALCQTQPSYLWRAAVICVVKKQIIGSHIAHFTTSQSPSAYGDHYYRNQSH